MTTSSQRKILLPWNAMELGSTMIRRVIEAANFSLWLGADLDVLVAPRPDAEKLGKLEAKIRALLVRGTQVSFEVDTSDLITATASAIKQKETWLATLTPEPRKTRLSDWQRELVERLEVPIVLVPAKATLGRLDSILVPLQGSPPGPDSGLDVGIQLAAKLRLPLDILHVTAPSGGDHSLIDEVSDVFHYDYPSQMEEMIVQASPLSSPSDRSVIRKLLHVRGDAQREIIRNIESYRHCLIALQWRGSFAPGRAETIKSILRASTSPLLLIKSAHQSRSTLQLGDTLIAA